MQNARAFLFSREINMPFNGQKQTKNKEDLTMIIGAILVHGMFWTGVFTTIKNVVIPATEGAIDGIKQGKKELKETKKKDILDKETPA